MNPQRIFSHFQRRRLTILQTVLLLSLVALCAVGMVSSMAQSQQEERKFEDITSERVPIKVKLKNEQSFKKMENKNWARELEIEVKNTGTKPIYFMYMNIVMQDLLVNSNPLVFQVSYGRKELVRFTTPIEVDDVPIQPGASVTLKVSNNQVKAYEGFREREKRADPKKVKFNLQLINFGDGTGLAGHDGRPIPNPARKQSRNMPNPKVMPDDSPPAFGVSGVDFPNKLLKSFYSLVPATNLRAYFSSPKDALASVPSSPSRDLCGCQNSNDCMYGVPDFASCPCDDPHEFLEIAPAGSCNHPFGSCFRTQTVMRPCDTQYNGTQYCTYQEDVEDCAIGDPTPTPTPEPTPTPDPDVCNGVARPNDDCTCAGTGASAFWQCNPMCDMPANYPKYPSIRLA